MNWKIEVMDMSYEIECNKLRALGWAETNVSEESKYSTKVVNVFIKKGKHIVFVKKNEEYYKAQLDIQYASVTDELRVTYDSIAARIGFDAAQVISCMTDGALYGYKVLLAQNVIKFGGLKFSFKDYVIYNTKYKQDVGNDYSTCIFDTRTMTNYCIENKDINEMLFLYKVKDMEIKDNMLYVKFLNEDEVLEKKSWLYKVEQKHDERFVKLNKIEG
jgi:hypothetical protein